MMLSSSPKLKYTKAAPRKSRRMNMNFRIFQGLYTNTRENILAGVMGG